MKKIFKKDISGLKEFRKFGDLFTQVESFGDNIYLYDRGSCYELVKGRKSKNPDESIVYVYPSSEDFGTYGYTMMKNYSRDFILRYVEVLRGLGTEKAQI